MLLPLTMTGLRKEVMGTAAARRAVDRAMATERATAWTRLGEVPTVLVVVSAAAETVIHLVKVVEAVDEVTVIGVPVVAAVASVAQGTAASVVVSVLIHVPSDSLNLGRPM